MKKEILKIISWVIIAGILIFAMLQFRPSILSDSPIQRILVLGLLAIVWVGIITTGVEVLRELHWFLMNRRRDGR